MNGLWRYYLSIALMDLASSLIRFTLPKWAADLRASDQAVGLLGTAQALTYILSCLVVGRWSDRVGREWLPRLGTALYVLVNLLIPLAGQSGSVLGLGLLNAGVGLILGLFWPVVEAYLAEQVHRGGLVRALGGFNLAWSLGAAGGPVVGGWLYDQLGPAAPFRLGAVAVALALACWWKPPHLRPLPGSSHPFPEHDERFTTLGRSANFVHWLVLSGMITLYPLLGRQVGLDASRMGQVQGCLHGVRTLVFIMLTGWTGWAYQWAPIWVACALGVIGCGLVGGTSTLAGHALGFACLGLFGGVAYSSSLLYSLNRPERKGEGGGYHEAVLGSGGVLGPAVGGWLSGTLGVRSPYFAGSGLIGLMVVGLVFWKRRWR